MQIVTKKVSELIPYENNPRVNEASIKYVANSIKEFGFKVPVIIDSNNVIVAGHTRILAAKELGLKEVPCIVADDLNEKQIKAFRLADNKVSEFSAWDYDKLDLEFLDLKDDFNFEDFGFFDIPTDEDDEPELSEHQNKEKEITCPFCGEKFYI